MPTSNTDSRPYLLEKPGLQLVRGSRARLSDQIYGQIFDQIVAGHLRVGAQLPSEKELCEQAGVSRPVVRQALLRLKADGLITSHQGAGSFVTHQPAARIKTFAAPQDMAGFLRCLEARITVEGDTAYCAAERHTEQQLQGIRVAHARFAESTQAGQLCPEEDLAFHRAIAIASNNDLYVTMLEGIHEAVLGFQKLVYNMKRSTSIRRMHFVVDEHASILAAIASRDGSHARIAMHYHLLQTRQRLLDRNAAH
ncbi:FadR/GntR family transcriptional regulator [Xylophilus sp.]|uniref:FadR/GntR family transcriptional regulator n=1 Tax=Xylophilus sp. TaxID=2653893 RepID=UPI0013BBE313|nr:FadR/GntR family transcriptional regulator [Xylophilus sp.]KAF1050183.1 MAG: Pyruvate dehydrogenase complex repressor [Xylophilus sp.]